MENIKKIPQVSVIMPTYNREHLIAHAIESVQAQTFSDWELIIVDDGSKDDTEKIIKKIQEQDQRIFYLKQSSNQGASVARNIGMRESTGQFIAFLDSDDVWLKEKLEKQINIFKQGDEKLGLVYTSAIFMNKETGDFRIKKAETRGDIFKEELMFNPVGGSSRVMIKRECLDVCGYFDESIFCNEDWDLWIRIAKHYKVGSEATPLVRYFEGNPDSLSVNSLKLINGYQTLWEKYNINSNNEKSIYAMHCVRLGHRLFYYGDARRGEYYLWQAFKIEPWNLKCVILFVLSFFGEKIYRKLTFYIMKKIGG